jgi:hypothetical protein
MSTSCATGKLAFDEFQHLWEHMGGAQDGADKFVPSEEQSADPLYATFCRYDQTNRWGLHVAVRTFTCTVATRPDELRSEQRHSGQVRGQGDDGRPGVSP